MFAFILLKKFAYLTIENYANPLQYYTKQANLINKIPQIYCEYDKKKFIILLNKSNQ